MNIKVKTAIPLTIFIIISLSKSAHIDAVMRNKFISTRPGFNQAQAPKLITEAGGYSKRYYQKIHINSLNDYAKLKDYVTYKRGTYSLATNLYPYSNFESLKWGTKYESYQFGKNIEAGKDSYSTSIGFLGSRSGDTLELLSVYGISSGKAVQVYNNVRYKKCKRKLFRRKCKWKVKRVPRGYNHEEIADMTNYLQHIAHNEVIKILPTSLGGENFTAEDMPVLGSGMLSGRQILYSVPGDKVMTSISTMIGRSVNEYSGNVMALVNQRRNGVVMMNKGRMWKVEVRRSGDLWDLILN